ncbi:MAG: tRNA dihydrouridine synthase DusB [Clostridiales Family XIII bacterium]|jgi:tRNA-dihydrouridine synthase B|nr:tRNA dihydrouridine synthase DusB [Clostridiales Family XIII bacterium]
MKKPCERPLGPRLRIGGLALESPFLLAPMAGVSDAPFRRLCREQGAAAVFSEMLSGKGLWHGGRNTEALLSSYDDERPLGYQIFGREPEIMGLAAEKLEGRGNALIDINMGCPVPKVVKNGEGSALMREPRLAGRIVEAVASRTAKPVTVKMRLGWDGGSVNAVELARVAEAAGAAAVAVHGRTREQYYSGDSDWNAIRLVKDAVSIPVIGNGDVRSGADAMRMLAETGCDFVMIARGALGNPWIFREALALYGGGEASAAPRPAERIDMAIRHFAMLLAEKGERAAVNEMRKHAAWYLKGIDGSSALRRRLNEAMDAAAFGGELERFRDGQECHGR